MNKIRLINNLVAEANNPVIICSNKNSLNELGRQIWDNMKIKIIVPNKGGSNVRGLRPDMIIFDDYHNIDKDTYETIIRGFAAVGSDNICSSIILLSCNNQT